MNINEIKATLNYLLDNNLRLSAQGLDKIAVNIVGAAGIGKTAIIKQLAQERGCGHVRINLSEIEEVGDIVGVPVREFQMTAPDGSEKWVTEKVLDQYTHMGYQLCADCQPRMSYAIPAWVPTDPDKEFILYLDDFSRANPLFMQAIMSLIQFGEYVSWKLPAKCHLILSSNPDNGEYNVTELDAAQRSRMINFNVEFDLNAFAKWMDSVGIRSELVNFALLTPEMFERKANINARSYTMFANAIGGFTSFDTDEALERVSLIAQGCFNDKWVSGMFAQFVHNKLDKLISPEDMLKGDWKSVEKRLIDNIYRNGKFDASVASTLTIRFSNYIDQYFDSSDVSDKNKSEKVIDRIIDVCTRPAGSKELLTEDLIYRMLKGINARHSNRCTKLLRYPQIREKLIGK